jgi:subtilisin-like proprotein convertase family protein
MINRLKHLIRGMAAAGFLLGFGAAPSASAATIIDTYQVNRDIADDSLIGLSDTRHIITDIVSITDISVSLTISGGFNGDYYAYLTHDSGFAVLLNRVGRTASNSDGYPDSGIDVTIESGAVAGDIHTYRDEFDPDLGPLTGTWQPDGRYVTPGLSFDTTPRTALLDSFLGLDPNGQWTLFIADASPVGAGRFDSWSLKITGLVPEPSSALLVAAGALFMLQRRSVRRR